MTPSAHSVRLARAAPARVLALGAFLKNRACLIDGVQVHWSAQHGDLVDAASRDALASSARMLLERASGPVQALAHDLHPDFHSSRLALSWAGQLGVPAIAVQHHHAHVGVALAEQAIDGPVIGLALDGMGLGSDGGAWGGEVLWVDGAARSHQWRRLDHLPLLALPGGDAAAREPWRMAAAVLFALGRGREIVTRLGPVVGTPAARLLHDMLRRDFNCPRSSSAGRWFDAAAGALGLSVRQSSEGQAAIALQSLAESWLAGHHEAQPALPPHDLYQIVAGLFALRDQPHDERAHGAAVFHLALVRELAARIVDASIAHQVRQVVLAGGCLANRLLAERLRAMLVRAGLAVVEPQAAGCGDAGLALGQAWIAASAVHCAGSRAPAVSALATEA